MEAKNMAARPILRKREMDFELVPKIKPAEDVGAPEAIGDKPLDNAGMPAPAGDMGMGQPATDLPDHTHDEYDQGLVKIQEIEQELQLVKPGGFNQEQLTTPEDDAGKPKGNQKDPMNINQEKLARVIRRAVEELTGVPERDIGKDLKPASETDGVPQTVQPAVGVSPSGGGFDSNDKTNKEDGLEDEVPKPASEFDKVAIKKNKMAQAKAHIERAKALMKEANGEDPTVPNPGAVATDPKKMDGSVPNKSPMGGTEQTGSEDPEANTPNDKRPIMKEQDGDEEEDIKKLKEQDEDIVEDDKEDAAIMEEAYKELKKEIKREKYAERRSLVGFTAKTNSSLQAKHSEYLTNKESTMKTIAEYLNKTGQMRYFV